MPQRRRPRTAICHLLPDTSASVHDEVRTIHVRGRIRAEEGNGTPVFISPGHAAQGNELGQLADKHIILVGIHATWRQAVAAYALLAPVGG